MHRMMAPLLHGRAVAFPDVQVMKGTVPVFARLAEYPHGFLRVFFWVFHDNHSLKKRYNL